MSRSRMRFVILTVAVLTMGITSCRVSDPNIPASSEAQAATVLSDREFPDPSKFVSARIVHRLPHSMEEAVVITERETLDELVRMFGKHQETPWVIGYHSHEVVFVAAHGREHHFLIGGVGWESDSKEGFMLPEWRGFSKRIFKNQMDTQPAHAADPPSPEATADR